jgi:hypothetical protein
MPTPPAGRAAPLRAPVRATLPGPHPATARTELAGHPRAPVSAARPGPPEADHAGPHPASTVVPPIAARTPTAPPDATTGLPPPTVPAPPAPETDPPPPTEAAVLKAKTAPQVATAAVVRTVRAVPLVATAVSAPKVRGTPLVVTAVSAPKARGTPLVVTAVSAPKARAVLRVVTAVSALKVRGTPQVVTAVGVPKARTAPQVATEAAVRTATKSRALRTVRRVSDPHPAAARRREARIRPVGVGPNPLGGQPAAATGTGPLRGPAVAVPGRALRPVNRATRAGTAHRGRPMTVPVTAAGRWSGLAVAGLGQDEVPGYPRPAVRPAAISLVRTPRAFLIPSPLISLTRKLGPS